MYLYNEEVGVTVMFSTCIRKVLGSNLGWDIDNPEGFMIFLTLYRKVPREYVYEATVASFQILSTLVFTNYPIILSVIDKVTK
jgi:hypothetical protein